MIQLARAGRRRRPRAAQAVRGRGRGGRSGRPTPRSPRRSSQTSGGDTLSRRHVHAAPGLRHGEGLQEDGKTFLPTRRSAAPSSTPRSTATSAPFELPQRWIDEEGRARQLKTPFNFVMHGRHHRRQLRQPGRQPRRRGRRHHLRRQHPVAAVGLPVRRPRQGRAVAVHSAGILDALKKVYSVPGLVKELTGK